MKNGCDYCHVYYKDGAAVHKPGCAGGERDEFKRKFEEKERVEQYHLKLIAAMENTKAALEKHERASDRLAGALQQQVDGCKLVIADQTVEIEGLVLLNDGLGKTTKSLREMVTTLEQNFQKETEAHCRTQEKLNEMAGSIDTRMLSAALVNNGLKDALRRTGDNLNLALLDQFGEQVFTPEDKAGAVKAAKGVVDSALALTFQSNADKRAAAMEKVCKAGDDVVFRSGEEGSFEDLRNAVDALHAVEKEGA